MSELCEPSALSTIFIPSTLTTHFNFNDRAGVYGAKRSVTSHLAGSISNMVCRRNINTQIYSEVSRLLREVCICDIYNCTVDGAW